MMAVRPLAGAVVLKLQFEKPAHLASELGIVRVRCIPVRAMAAGAVRLGDPPAVVVRTEHRRGQDQTDQSGGQKLGHVDLL